MPKSRVSEVACPGFEELRTVYLDYVMDSGNWRYDARYIGNRCSCKVADTGQEEGYL